jgi:hypothetical protein
MFGVLCGQLKAQTLSGFENTLSGASSHCMRAELENFGDSARVYVGRDRQLQDLVSTHVSPGFQGVAS